MASFFADLLRPNPLIFRVYRLLVIYGAIETILKTAHRHDYIDLGYFYTITEHRNEILRAIYNVTWKPISPVIVPIIWGLCMKVFMLHSTPMSPLPLILVAAASAVAVMWILGGCFPIDKEDVAGTVRCTRECGEAVFSTVLMFGLILGSWMRWSWDAGLSDWADQWELNEKEDLVKMTVQEESNTKICAGSSGNQV